MKKVILKSSSPRRIELLKAMNIDFIQKSFDVDESMDSNLTPEENVKNVSLRKAIVKNEEYNDYIQIGCDTIVALDNKIYVKPKDLDDAKKMLEELSGKTHKVISGLTVIYKDKIYNTYVTSFVTFKDLSEEDIINYVNTKECLGKAGAYAIQGIGKCLVEKFEGSLNNIIGLPTEELEKILGEINGVED